MLNAAWQTQQVYFIYTKHFLYTHSLAHYKRMCFFVELKWNQWLIQQVFFFRCRFFLCF
jgi:hypothetical protein